MKGKEREKDIKKEIMNERKKRKKESTFITGIAFSLGFFVFLWLSLVVFGADDLK